MPPVSLKPPPARTGMPAALRGRQPPGRGRGSTAKPRVLAVDDTPDALRQLRDCLKSMGMECFTCQNGQSAIEFLAREMVDLIIVDVLMPGVDGYEVCRAAKHDPRTRDIPVIFLTGDMRMEDTAHGVELGAFDYLSKPVEMAECTVRLQAALKMKLLQDELKVQLMAPEEQRRVQRELQTKMDDFQQGMTVSHWQTRFGQIATSFVEELDFPVANALGSLRQMIVDERLPEGTRDRLTMLHTHFRKVGEHLRRLQAISRYSRKPQAIRLAELTDDITRLLQPEFHYFEIRLTVQYDPAVEWFGMRSEIGRCILYLLHNAIEALSEKTHPTYRPLDDEEPAEEEKHKTEPEILIRVGREESVVFVRIADNGPGIAAAIQDRVFNPQFTTKAAPHAGAGLHLARGIARAAQGDIELESPSGDWATQLSLLLPANMFTEEELAAGEAAEGLEELPAEAALTEEAPAEAAPAEESDGEPLVAEAAGEPTTPVEERPPA